MGMIGQLLAGLFGGGQNVIRDTAEVFRPNAEAQAARAFGLDNATLGQMAAEFAWRGQRGRFDRFMDGVNRLPRPALVLGVFALLIWTARDPVGAAEVFTAWAIIPSEFWYVVLAIVTFYFGGRYQAKVQEMQTRLAGVAGGVPMVLDSLAALDGLRSGAESPSVADSLTDARLTIDVVEAAGADPNPALDGLGLRR